MPYTRSFSMPLLSNAIVASGRPRSKFSRGCRRYTHSSVKNSGQRAYSRASSALPYAWYSVTSSSHVGMSSAARGRTFVPSVIDDAPPVAVRAADERFGDRVLGAGRGVDAAEFDDAREIRPLPRTLLRELDDLAVVRRHVTGRAEKVRLAQSPALHLWRIVGESEVRPYEVERVRPARLDMPRRQRIDLLLDDDAREDGRHHDGRSVPPRLVDDVEHAIVVQRHVRLEARNALRHRTRSAFVAPGDHARVPSVRVGDEVRLLVGAPQAERDEPRVQQSRVIRVLDVLLHQFPVAVDPLSRITEDRERAAVEHAVEVVKDLVAQIPLEWLDVGIEGCEYDAVPRRDRKPRKPVVLAPESGRHAALHAALAANAAHQRDAEQASVEPVRPLVVRAGEFVSMAEVFAAECHAPMRADVLDDVDRAVRVAHHDHRPLADRRALEIAGIRDLRLEPDIAPVAAVEKALEFAQVDVVARVRGEGDPVRPLTRPAVDRCCDVREFVHGFTRPGSPVAWLARRAVKASISRSITARSTMPEGFADDGRHDRNGWKRSRLFASSLRSSRNGSG